jgi:rhodanese-related sulfurtransferase
MARKRTTTRKKQKRSTQARNTPQRSNTPAHKDATQQKVAAQRKNNPQRKYAPKRKNTLLIWGGGALLMVMLGLSAIFLGNQRNTQAAEKLPVEISVDQAYQKYQEGAYVLDVRTPEEWDAYHAPGTTLIPLDELSARLNEVPQDKEIVVVCRTDNRSADGRDILLDAGFQRVTSMSGGLYAWREAGYPLEGQSP